MCERTRIHARNHTHTCTRSRTRTYRSLLLHSLRYAHANANAHAHAHAHAHVRAYICPGTVVYSTFNNIQYSIFCAHSHARPCTRIQAFGTVHAQAHAHAHGLAPVQVSAFRHARVHSSLRAQALSLHWIMRTRPCVRKLGLYTGSCARMLVPAHSSLRAQARSLHWIMRTRARACALVPASARRGCARCVPCLRTKERTQPKALHRHMHMDIHTEIRACTWTCTWTCRRLRVRRLLIHTSMDTRTCTRARLRSKCTFIKVCMQCTLHACKQESTFTWKSAH
jgi:hypothetical protein